MIEYEDDYVYHIYISYLLNFPTWKTY